MTPESKKLYDELIAHQDNLKATGNLHQQFRDGYEILGRAYNRWRDLLDEAALKDRHPVTREPLDLE